MRLALLPTQFVALMTLTCSATIALSASSQFVRIVVRQSSVRNRTKRLPRTVSKFSDMSAYHGASVIQVDGTIRQTRDGELAGQASADADKQGRLWPHSHDSAYLCDGTSLPAILPSSFLPHHVEGHVVAQSELQGMYNNYRVHFPPERRTARDVRYWSCNVIPQLHGLPVLAAGPGSPPLVAPNSNLNERRDCDALPWLSQFLRSEDNLMYDIGASDGECALTLLALGYHVTLVDASYDLPEWRAWVQMSLHANGWDDRAVLAPAIATGLNEDNGAPSLDRIVRSSLANRTGSVGIVKLDVDDGDPQELEVLRGGNLTMGLASLLQVENDGWVSRGEAYEQELLERLCANGMQPYAIWPDVVGQTVPSNVHKLYFNSPARCQDMGLRRFRASCPTCADIDHWTKTRRFVLEPICACSSIAMHDAALHLAECAYQLAAVQIRSRAFELVRAKFGACADFPTTTKR